MDLAVKNCIDCKDSPKISGDELSRYLLELDGWQVIDGKKIKKQFHFPDFVAAMAFVNKVADLAEAQDHHPDIFINFKRVTLELTTHQFDCLTENDFILASHIDTIFRPSVKG